MEEKNMNATENEDFEEVTETEEAAGSGNAGALVVGIVGGFLAYAVIDGGKKLLRFINERRREKKAAASPTDNVIDVEFGDVKDDQTDSEEESSEE